MPSSSSNFGGTHREWQEWASGKPMEVQAALVYVFDGRT